MVYPLHEEALRPSERDSESPEGDTLMGVPSVAFVVTMSRETDHVALVRAQRAKATAKCRRYYEELMQQRKRSKRREGLGQ